MNAVATPAPVRLGIRTNLAQFSLLVGVNALVGGMVGQERTVLPLLGDQVFHLGALTATLTFLIAFGTVKAMTNFAAGALCDRYGRKPVLIAGWVVGIPVPLILMWAPSWAWIVAANALLGVNQGLSWSATVIMKIDLAGPKQRGLAMGLNEAAGYGAVGVTSFATGLIAAHLGLRPAPFFLGLAFVGVGLGVSALFVRDTHGGARHESAPLTEPHTHGADLSTKEVFVQTSYRNRALSAASQAGLVNNLNDGMAWGLLPILFARRGLSVGGIGTLGAIYPFVWGLGQLVTGALSDRIGRKWLIAVGMWVQAIAITLIAASTSFGWWAVGAVLLGAGTAMVYPTLLAVIGDVAHPEWRASAVGVYRLWRDAGFAVGALITGITADALGLTTSILVVAALTALSGAVVAFRMYETAQRATPNLDMALGRP